MRRRDFLSLVSCAALSAVVPRPKYFFLNGLWHQRWMGVDLAIPGSEIKVFSTYEVGTYILLQEQFFKNGKMFRKIGSLPWEEVENHSWHGKPPYSRVSLIQPPREKPDASA